MFQALSFKIASGTALVVTGANGIGKSTLLRTLAGLVSLSEGSIKLDGASNSSDDPRPANEYCHYFGHQDAVKPALTALENLSFWRAFSAPAETSPFSGEAMKPNEALQLLGVGHTAHLPAGFLSAGQKRRLSLARLLITPRPVWLMDEPTSALDAASEQTLLNLMNGHTDRGGMIATATHTPLALNGIKKLHMEAASPAPLDGGDAE